MAGKRAKRKKKNSGRGGGARPRRVRLMVKEFSEKSKGAKIGKTPTRSGATSQSKQRKEKKSIKKKENKDDKPGRNYLATGELGERNSSPHTDRKPGQGADLQQSKERPTRGQSEEEYNGAKTKHKFCRQDAPEKSRKRFDNHFFSRSLHSSRRMLG